MATYRTKDGSKTGFVPGVGVIVNGLLKNAPDNLENHNLVKVEDQPTQLAVSAAPAAPVASVTPAPAVPVTPLNKETN